MCPDLVVQSDERIDFLGQTKTGKTFLVERLAAEQPRIKVVDSKHRVNWKGFYLTDDPIAALLEDRVIYRPPTGVPPDDWWEAALESLTDRGGGVIYLDEAPVIMTQAKIPTGLAKIYRVGSELGVGVWASMQESTTIHNTVLRQAQQIICFYNQGTSDREKMMGIIGDMAEVTAHLPVHEFIVFVQGETKDGEPIHVYKVNP